MLWFMISESFSLWSFPQKKNVSNHFTQLFNVKWKSWGLWFGKFVRGNDQSKKKEVKPPLIEAFSKDDPRTHLLFAQLINLEIRDQSSTLKWMPNLEL